jgi:hypothetical protein
VAYKFAHATVTFLVVAFAGALILSMVLGWLCVQLCVLVIRRSSSNAPVATA